MSGSVSSASSAPATATPPVAPATEEKPVEKSNVETTKFTSFSKALIPSKGEKWYMTAIKVLACVTVVPMLGALLMDALRGAYNWITTKKPQESNEGSTEAAQESTEAAQESTEATQESTQAAQDSTEAKEEAPAAPSTIALAKTKSGAALTSVKTRTVEVYNNHPKMVKFAAGITAIGLAYVKGYIPFLG